MSHRKQKQNGATQFRFAADVARASAERSLAELARPPAELLQRHRVNASTESRPALQALLRPHDVLGSCLGVQHASRPRCVVVRPVWRCVLIGLSGAPGLGIADDAPAAADIGSGVPFSSAPWKRHKSCAVVDMAAVIEVIGMLERTPITKDTLERTRLGKYINELRKRTNNDSLARRAKELVKSWRRLLPCDQQQTPNGGGPPVVVVGPGPGPGIGPGPGPGLPSGPRRSPSCSSVSNSPVPPSLLAAAAAVTTAAAGPGLGPRRNGGFKPVSPACCPSAPCSPGSPLAHPHPRSPPPLEPVAKNNVANKRLRKSVASSDGPADCAKKAAWSPPNGVHPWDPIPSGNSAFESVRNRIATTSTTSPRLPKVKTTQQLIADLKAKSGLSLDGGTAAAAAVAAAASATPPPTSSRPKRSGNYSLLGTDDETSRTKSELMDRFLKSSVPNGPSPASPTTAKGGTSAEVAAILSALPEIGPEVGA
ncbi:hypothetical protein HPB50_027144 [Hyalomma asiaticum]|uniref:Uncharacterized protein n=1 Tax=Hyalomma asiaticum TaxID=266040 RepID=A0ACB7T4U5_HYAAI|nr:hypothetical protein HPB50_027144 [Hyalomma asiaticum]